MKIRIITVLAFVIISFVFITACTASLPAEEKGAAGQEEGERIEGNMAEYYKMSDGTWMCDGYTYKYCLEISGRMPNAAKDSTFTYLSNIEEISFEQAYKAAGVSSNLDDYFSPEDAVLVDMK